MLSVLDSFLANNAPWLDTLALFMVCAISIKDRCLVSLIVLADFTLTYFGQDMFKNSSLWFSMGLDYHYSLGIKDTLVALLLWRIRACPLLVAMYTLAAISCFTVWGAYARMNYEAWLQLYYAWSPIYFIIMVAQVFVFFMSGTDYGRYVRERALHINWRWLFQSFYCDSACSNKPRQARD